MGQAQSNPSPTRDGVIFYGLWNLNGFGQTLKLPTPLKSSTTNLPHRIFTGRSRFSLTVLCMILDILRGADHKAGEEVRDKEIV